MRKILFFIAFLSCITGEAQVIRANAFYRPFSGSLLLDTYTGARGAYSLRKLRTAYNGSAIRVRRSSDNTEQDIGFSGNELDTAALKSFVGSSNGFIVNWYDQSGNSKTATEAVASQQPRICLSGVIERFNGKPTIYFQKSSSNQLATGDSLFSGANPRSMWVVYKPNTTTTGVYAVCGQSIGNITGSWFVIQFRNQFATGDPYLAAYVSDLTGNDAITTDPKIVDANYDGTTASLYKNNAEEQTAAKSYNTSIRIFRIGRSEDASSEYAEAYISEIIVWGSSQSSNRSGIYGNINSFYSIY